MGASVQAELARARALTAELIELVAELRARLDSGLPTEVRASRGSAEEVCQTTDPGEPQIAKSGARLADGELRGAFEAALDARRRRPRMLPI